MFRLAAVVTMIASLGCTTLNYGGKENETLESENHVLRKKVIMIERRNSILEEENIQKKKAVKDGQVKIENQTRELKLEKEKYLRDTALLENKYDNLKKKNEILEQQSSEKIKELTELNKKIETELGAKIAQLGNDLKDREAVNAAEIDRLKKQAADSEFTLSKNIEELKKTLTEKDALILGLDAELKNARDDMKKFDDERTAKDVALKESHAKLKEYEKKIDYLVGKVKELEENVKKSGESAAENKKTK